MFFKSDLASFVIVNFSMHLINAVANSRDKQMKGRHDLEPPQTRK